MIQRQSHGQESKTYGLFRILALEAAPSLPETLDAPLGYVVSVQTVSYRAIVNGKVETVLENGNWMLKLFSFPRVEVQFTSEALEVNR